MKANFEITHSDEIKGVSTIKPNISSDIRGNIWSSFISSQIDSLIPSDHKFIHDKFSESRKDVLSGIHGDSKSWKLVPTNGGWASRRTPLILILLAKS